MKVIIAGSRDITDYAMLEEAVHASGFEVTEVVSGGARGVDTMGERWAKEHGVPVKVFKAQWDLHGKRAGPFRNMEMGDYADALIALWDGKSRGTLHMINYSESRHLRVWVKRIP